MIVASGFIECNSEEDIASVCNELQNRNVEITDKGGQKIVFLIERETDTLVKNELENLKNIAGVINVYLAYFSIDDNTQE